MALALTHHLYCLLERRVRLWSRSEGGTSAATSPRILKPSGFLGNSLYGGGDRWSLTPVSVQRCNTTVTTTAASQTAGAVNMLVNGQWVGSGRTASVAHPPHGVTPPAPHTGCCAPAPPPATHNTQHTHNTLHKLNSTHDTQTSKKAPQQQNSVSDAGTCFSKLGG